MRRLRESNRNTCVSLSPAPFVRHDAVLQLDVGRAGFVLRARPAEDEEDRAAAFFALGVFVLPDLGVALTVDARAFAWVAERRLDPRGRRLAGLDLVERR